VRGGVRWHANEWCQRKGRVENCDELFISIVDSLTSNLLVKTRNLKGKQQEKQVPVLARCWYDDENQHCK